MIKIEIKTDNSVFEGELKGLEVARILRNIADDFAVGFAFDGESKTTYNDVNGNKVAEVTEK